MFDLTAFKAGWRAACSKYGVDPVEGATSYQVAAYKADVEKARKQAARTYWWRQDPGIWADPGWCFSDVEAECYRRLFRQAWDWEVSELSRQATNHADTMDLKPLREIVALPVAEGAC